MRTHMLEGDSDIEFDDALDALDALVTPIRDLSEPTAATEAQYRKSMKRLRSPSDVDIMTSVTKSKFRYNDETTRAVQNILTASIKTMNKDKSTMDALVKTPGLSEFTLGNDTVEYGIRQRLSDKFGSPNEFMRHVEFASTDEFMRHDEFASTDEPSSATKRDDDDDVPSHVQSPFSEWITFTIKHSYTLTVLERKDISRICTFVKDWHRQLTVLQEYLVSPLAADSETQTQTKTDIDNTLKHIAIIKENYVTWAIGKFQDAIPTDPVSESITKLKDIHLDLGKDPNDGPDGPEMGNEVMLKMMFGIDGPGTFHIPTCFVSSSRQIMEYRQYYTKALLKNFEDECDKPIILEDVSHVKYYGRIKNKNEYGEVTMVLLDPNTDEPLVGRDGVVEHKKLIFYDIFFSAVRSESSSKHGFFHDPTPTAVDASKENRVRKAIPTRLFSEGAAAEGAAGGAAEAAGGSTIKDIGGDSGDGGDDGDPNRFATAEETQGLFDHPSEHGEHGEPGKPDSSDDEP